MEWTHIGYEVSMRYLFDVVRQDPKGREMPETDLTVFDSDKEAIDYYFKWYREHGYPMVDITDYDPRQELADLVAFDETSIEHNEVLDQSMVGCGFHHIQIGEKIIRKL